MLGRAAPVSCCTTDLLVTWGESFAFFASVFLLAMSVFPLAGTDLLSADAPLDWNSSSKQSFILFQSLNE